MYNINSIKESTKIHDFDFCQCEVCLIQPYVYKGLKTLLTKHKVYVMKNSEY